MATPRQIEANRINAKKSTGPKTADGKARSRGNALKHALTSTRTLVGNEDAVEYAKLRSELYRDYAPANAQEELLVDQIVSATWRTLRSREMEQSLANMSIEQFQAKRKHSHSRPHTSQTSIEALVLSMVEDDLWKLLHRYDTQISRDFFRSVEALRKMQNDRLRHAREETRDFGKRESRRPQIQHTKAAGAANWLPFANAAKPAEAREPAVQAEQVSPPDLVSQNVSQFG